MKKIFSIFFLVCTITVNVFATHMRAGEITYKHIKTDSTGLAYEFTITTYTYTLSPADRPQYKLSMGDGHSMIVPRISKTAVPNADEVSLNIYIGEYTYNGLGTYIVSLEDSNRNGGVNNIPNSVNTPFFIQTILVINPFLGAASSPELLNPPIDNGCVNVPFYHNPGAYDADGDSLSYKLIKCKGDAGLDIAGYTFPTASHFFTLNTFTGELVWDSPVQQGEYNVAILIQAWRYGQLICSITRDMQITITTCKDIPPIIDPISDTCVLEGTLLKFNVHAHDTDVGDIVSLTASGGPFMLSSNAATFATVSHADSVTSTFSWQPACEQVQKQPYLITFRASDNASPVNLVDIKSVMITVVAPAPPNLAATPIGNNIHLIWNKSPCLNAIGYKIYRRNGFFGYVHGHCETGVPAYTGYVEIATVSGVNDTNYTDTNNGNGLVHGRDYCYMVTAYFNDLGESYASNEACTSLIKDVPIITNVSVNNTDATNGSIYIAWSRPTEIDTTKILGPFKYLIYHSNDFNGAHFVLKDSLNGLNDTTYVDTLINTIDTPWSYRIDLWNNTPGDRYLIGSTEKASSIFLTFTPTDNQLTLNFAPVVPWVNDTFVVYRKNPVTLNFDSIGFSLTTQYIDKNLANKYSYCYKVKSIGGYFAPGIIYPIINFSQKACGIPIDNVPPCDPNLAVIPNCDKVENELIWTDPNHSCANDVIFYKIYYSPTENGDFVLIDTINNPNDTTFIHKNLNSIAGCYIVTAVDSFLNESSLNNKVCLDIDSCSLYVLPNVFTPNGDGSNDEFIPFPYHFVQKIDLKIFNRWGKIVYTTENPDINWNGKDKFNGMECSDGVYFYICDVYEIRLNGIKKRAIHGYIHILR